MKFSHFIITVLYLLLLYYKVLASEVPSIKNQFSPPTFVSGLPNGIDINMVKYAASEDSTSDEEV